MSIEDHEHMSSSSLTVVSHSDERNFQKCQKSGPKWGGLKTCVNQSQNGDQWKGGKGLKKLKMTKKEWKKLKVFKTGERGRKRRVANRV